jgi:hypothetical protein
MSYSLLILNYLTFTRMKTILCMTLLSLCAIAAMAQSDDDFKFIINDENAVTLTAYIGSGGDVTIPGEATLNGRTYPVTAIGNAAFENNTALTSVGIGHSVTSIGEAAFAACSSLKSVELPNSVTGIGAYAFYNSGLTSVEIPHSVTSIGAYAFVNCSNLTSVTLSNSLTSIEERTFLDCISLTSVTLPNSLTSIEEGAFWGCSALTSVEIPHSVTSIRGSAFRSCTGLKDVYVSWLTPLSGAASAFLDITPGEITLHVPEGTEAAYGAIMPWKEFRIVGDLPNAVASPEAQKVWSHGGLLHVHTPQAERIEVYALTGQRLYAARKDAGPTVLRLPSLPHGLLIVRGSTGWTEKVVNSE